MYYSLRTPHSWIRIALSLEKLLANHSISLSVRLLDCVCKGRKSCCWIVVWGADEVKWKGWHLKRITCRAVDQRISLQERLTFQQIRRVNTASSNPKGVSLFIHFIMTSAIRLHIIHRFSAEIKFCLKFLTEYYTCNLVFFLSQWHEYVQSILESYHIKIYSTHPMTKPYSSYMESSSFMINAVAK